MSSSTITRCCALLVTMIALSACSTIDSIQQVNAWEKGTLAKKEMTFENDALESKFAEHIYGSKEAATGGAGVGGGGCGCN
ncbi:DUF4266 domain-containing protein [Undibacterium sp. SXout7W]|uniref:DUF4266 domain-containing protein n=1 Tax=Undibacterium sp. SXout7W TaxID=3413049 RepID=UPI003BF23BA2